MKERTSTVSFQPRIVLERLRHSSIQITLDTYSHAATGLQEAVKRFYNASKVRHNNANVKGDFGQVRSV